ncbi:helix-turn-helix transcriptional regulator [Rosenbergiella nectarea]|uniref:helix-turn-helix transcriptional regulator n=1 Tax=Rosenbergiella nectarea TaxID=988801 RepID=UPI001BDAF00D|nr:AlpA family transcriptional regulator [Rosenbergiella nectarea]MBT0729640.1 AlpA family transcriptional regulator [Rosenbergiella nectarea subsp. apis]
MQDKKERLIDFKEALNRTKKSWAYELIKQNRFPKPIKIGSRSIAFVESEIDAWIDARIAERDTAEVN